MGLLSATTNLLLATGKPLEFLDCHHHFYDTWNNDFQSFLGRFNPDAAYLPEDYRGDVVESIQDSEILTRRNVQHIGSVHVEAMPDDGMKEVEWVESLLASSDTCTVKAFVASCDLASDDVQTKLEQLKDASPRVKGIRWILDCTGKRFDEEGNVMNPATHVGNLRHDGIDYLRSNDGEADPAFERGFAQECRD